MTEYLLKRTAKKSHACSHNRSDECSYPLYSPLLRAVATARGSQNLLVNKVFLLGVMNVVPSFKAGNSKFTVEICKSLAWYRYANHLRNVQPKWGLRS